jgi:hypothetical protein
LHLFAPRLEGLREKFQRCTLMKHLHKVKKVCSDAVEGLCRQAHILGGSFSSKFYRESLFNCC